MTNIKLATPKYDEIQFCPFCGAKLSKMLGAESERKSCVGTFHFLVIRSEDEELL